MSIRNLEIAGGLVAGVLDDLRDGKPCADLVDDLEEASRLLSCVIAEAESAEEGA